jgi:DNA-binding FadR family transcriptional regulator
MVLASVGVLPLSEQVYRQLLDGILDGSLGEVLPSERELATTFAVNRHAVREAIKRLQQANLVEVNQGGATRVLPLPAYGRLDLLPELLVRRGTLDMSVVAAVLEMRACIGADAARLCAGRSPEVGAALVAHIPGPDASNTELEQASLAYWAQIVGGSNNIGYQLALNTLVAGIDMAANAPGGSELERALHQEYRRADALERLAAAITEGDSTAAERAATELLGPVAQFAAQVA